MKAHPAWMRERARELYVPYVFGHKKIAAELGISSSTVARWVNNQHAERQRANSRKRKQRYRGTCVDCGGPTSPHSPNRLVKRCHACDMQYRHANRRWTRETVIEAIHRWHQEHGRRPAASDWVKSGPEHPAVTSIYAPPDPVFPSWSAALKAAGYQNVRTGPGPGTKWFDRDIARALREQGLTDTQIGNQLGVTPSAIWAALGPRSTPLRRPRPTKLRRRTREQRIADLQHALAFQTPTE